MARLGAFSGPSEEYGVPLSFAHPPDNSFAKAKWSPQLLDPKLKLTEDERQALQDEIDALMGLGHLTQQFSYD